MELSHPNAIYKPWGWVWHKLRQSTARPKGVLRNERPTWMEPLWRTLVVVLGLCNRLNGSPDANPSSCTRAQGEPEQGGHEGPVELHQPPHPPPRCPGPSRASQIHRGAANPLQSWDFLPQMILFQPLSPGNQSPTRTQNPWEGQHGCCKLGEGRQTCTASSDQPWVTCSAQLLSQGGTSCA